MWLGYMSPLALFFIAVWFFVLHSLFFPDGCASVKGSDAFPVVLHDKYLGFDMIISSFLWHLAIWCNKGEW